MFIRFIFRKDIKIFLLCNKLSKKIEYKGVIYRQIATFGHRGS